MAAIKIQTYRSRLYVLRLLLDRVPADRLGAFGALVGVLVKMAPRGGGDSGGSGVGGGGGSGSGGGNGQH